MAISISRVDLLAPPFVLSSEEEESVAADSTYRPARIESASVYNAARIESAATPRARIERTEYRPGRIN